MYRYIKQLMALPFLPSGHIVQTFDALMVRANSAPLREFVQYIQRQWIQNQLHPVQTWTVFPQTVRTNNDVEGWHNRLNKKATPEGVGVYKLIPKLRREAQLVFASVAAEDLNRDIDPKYVSLQCRLKDAWTKYEANEISTTHFLKMVSNLYGVPDKE